MRTEGKIWVIFDSAKNKKTRPLSVVQAQVMILGFKSRELHHYHIWSPGWDEWLPLSNYLASDQKYFVKAQPPEPVAKKKEPSKMLKSISSSLKADISERTSTGSKQRPSIPGSEPDPKNEDYGYYYNGFSGDDLSLSGLPDRPGMQIVLSQNNSTSSRDRRLASRHDFKIEALLLTTKGSTFRSYTRNISLNGILLEDEIPKDFFNRPFEMILINKCEKDPRKSRLHLAGRIIGDLSDPKRLLFIRQTEVDCEKLKKLIEDYTHQQEKIKKSGS